MSTLSSLLSILHLVGFALATGAATVKVVMLLRSGAGGGALASYLQLVRPVTRVLLTGLALVLASGIAWLALGRELVPRLVVKLVLVAAVVVLGPVIDKLAEPRFLALAAAGRAPASPEFLRARGRYVALEVVATALFYAIVIVWVAG